MNQGEPMPIETRGDDPGDSANAFEQEMGGDEARIYLEYLARMASEQFLRALFSDQLRSPLSRISKLVEKIERDAERMAR